jgi:hypothetical protein
MQMKVKKIRAKSQRKKRVKTNNKGEKNKQSKMNNGLYLQLFLWLSSTKKNSNLTDILQHPAVVSMIIAIRLLPIHSPKDNTISIAFLNQHHHIIMYIPKQLSAAPFASNIQHYESFISRRGGRILVVYKSHQNNTIIIVSNVVSNNLRHLYLLDEQLTTGCSVSNILEHRLVLDTYILSYSCNQ